MMRAPGLDHKAMGISIGVISPSHDLQNALLALFSTIPLVKEVQSAARLKDLNLVYNAKITLLFVEAEQFFSAETGFWLKSGKKGQIQKIVLANNACEEKRAIQGGADHVFLKGISAEKLINFVQSYLCSKE